METLVKDIVDCDLMDLQDYLVNVSWHSVSYPNKFTFSFLSTTKKKWYDVVTLLEVSCHGGTRH